jgi:hypothetical protein
VLTREEWDAIVKHDLAAGTIRGEGSYDEIADMSFAEKATAEFGAADE